MITINAPLDIDETDLQALQTMQQNVNNTIDYSDQVTLADIRWKSKPRLLFQRIKKALELICPGACRCGYCEDSLADEVEHIRPKSWFPNEVFDPNNYLFACGPCNGPKNNNYAVVDAFGQLEHAQRTKNGPVVPPPVGQDALIHPRYDVPADFFFLDLVNTFKFEPRHKLDPQRIARAVYTLKTLHLNKDPLLTARREAFNDFAARLAHYYQALCNGESSAHLDKLKNELLKKQHITVWREMQTQCNLLPYLKKLFELVPGADQW